ncbi:MAG TPA: VWA domain-containing protein [Pyrinomonadaceae bacterium]|nr:VWA domain-containing protein [Pyrinomonadaceae bacterium]
MSQSRFEPTPKAGSVPQPLRAFFNCALGLALVLGICSVGMGQAGRRPSTTNDAGVLVNVVAKRTDSSQKAITARQLAIYDNGIEQIIRNLTPDPSPARIVLLVDNSLTLRADIEKLEQAAREFAYEIYEGDKLLIVGYDEQAEIVADWTDDAKSIESSLKLFRKKGQPHLFDAATAVIDQALRATPGQKRVIVVISDGLDRGSKTTFDKILAELQKLDITVYAVQAQDRTRGAIRRDVPKPKQVIDKLVEGTGGAIFSIEEPAVAAKAICDELRKNRYVLSYVPSSAPFGELRNLLVVGDEGITVRSKTAQQPN